MESLFEEHIQKVTEAIRTREEAISLPSTYQRDLSNEEENLKTKLLDLEKEREELMLRLNKLESQIKDTQSEIQSIQEKAAENSRKEVEAFNQKIKEEIEKAVQAGKQEEYALIICGSKIREYDLKFNKETNSENQFKIEKIEQKALIELAFKIDLDAEKTIKKKFEGSVVEYSAAKVENKSEDKNESQIEDNSDWSKLIKTSNGKEFKIQRKKGKITAFSSEYKKTYNPMKTEFELSDNRQLHVEEKDDRFELTLKKGDKLLECVPLDLDTNVKIHQSKAEEDVFYFFGVKEKCMLRCNQKV